jgi:hypothetical protein
MLAIHFNLRQYGQGGSHAAGNQRQALEKFVAGQRSMRVFVVKVDNAGVHDVNFLKGNPFRPDTKKPFNAWWP